MASIREGKIYKLLIGDCFYYGSTFSTLEKRRYNHTVKARIHTQIKVYSKANEIGINNIKIELVEIYPCQTRKELLERENYYIITNLSNPLCLNSRVSYLSIEEKKDKQKIYNKIYRNTHIDEIKEYEKTYKSNQQFTDEQKEKKRIYQREYMRNRRSNLPKKDRKKRTEEEIALSKKKKIERDRNSRINASDEVKERRRLRHNELQRIRRSSKK